MYFVEKNCSFFFSFLFRFPFIVCCLTVTCILLKRTVPSSSLSSSVFLLLFVVSLSRVFCSKELFLLLLFPLPFSFYCLLSHCHVYFVEKNCSFFYFFSFLFRILRLFFVVSLLYFVEKNCSFFFFSPLPTLPLLFRRLAVLLVPKNCSVPFLFLLSSKCSFFFSF